MWDWDLALTERIIIIIISSSSSSNNNNNNDNNLTGNTNLMNLMYISWGMRNTFNLFSAVLWYFLVFKISVSV
jgi:hypothetical protein